MDSTTEALARRLGIKAQSIRSRLCRTGSYYGVRPDTLPNGRLWPPDAFERIKCPASVADERAAA